MHDKCGGRRKRTRRARRRERHFAGGPGCTAGARERHRLQSLARLRLEGIEWRVLDGEGRRVVVVGEGGVRVDFWPETGAFRDHSRGGDMERGLGRLVRRVTRQPAAGVGS